MENLKGSDRFRQLLKKFNQPNGTENAPLMETSIRKSKREIKKTVKYDASPYVRKTKETKSVERKDKSRERLGKVGEQNETYRKRVTGKDGESPVARRTQQPDLKGKGQLLGQTPPKRSAFTRERIDEVEDESDDYGRRVRDGESPVMRRPDLKVRGQLLGQTPPKRSAFTRERIDEVEDQSDDYRRRVRDSESPVMRRPQQPDLKVRGQLLEQTPPKRSAFTRERLDEVDEENDAYRRRVAARESESPVLRRPQRPEPRAREQLFAQPPPQRSAFTRVRTNENGRSSDRTLLEPLSQSHVNNRRAVNGHHDEYAMRRDDQSERNAPERYMRENCMPEERTFNQSRMRFNSSQYGNYASEMQPFVRLVDVARTQEQSFLSRSRMEMPPPAMRRPAVRAQEQSMWQNSRITQVPPQRFDGSFLRPPTPEGAAELAKKEESKFLDAVSEFRNCPALSAIEVIFLLNNLENSMMRKMIKCIRSNSAAQTLRMATIPTEDTTKNHMIHEWLRSNSSIAPPSEAGDLTGVRSKRLREPSQHEYAKKMRVAAGTGRAQYHRLDL